MKMSPATARTLCLVGSLGVAAGALMYALILRRSFGGPAESPMQTVRSLVFALVLAHAGAVAQMAGLALLRDRFALRLSGAFLAALLVTLNYKALDAAMGRVPGAIAAGLIGALFLLVPWFVLRGERNR